MELNTSNLLKGATILKDDTGKPIERAILKKSALKGD